MNLFKRWTTNEHERVGEDLSAYLDGELSARDKQRVERHLKACADCRAELESLRQTVALLHEAPAIRPPRSFLLPVTAGVPARTPLRPRLGYAYLQAATAIAAVLLVLVVSGDVFLRFGAATSGALAPSTQEAAPEGATALVNNDQAAGAQAFVVQSSETDTGLRMAVSEQATPEPVSAQPTSAPTAAMSKAALSPEPAPTEETVQTLTGETPAPRPVPSWTFGVAAAPPKSTPVTDLPVTATAEISPTLYAEAVETITESTESTPDTTEMVQPSESPVEQTNTWEPTLPVVPTATPEPTPPVALAVTPEPTQQIASLAIPEPPPTGTPVPAPTALPPVVTPNPTVAPVPSHVTLLTSPEAGEGQFGNRGGGPAMGSAGTWALLESARSFLPFLEGTLAVLMVVLFGLTLWWRQRSL